MSEFASELESLARLRSDGLLSDEEYEKMKADLIARSISGGPDIKPLSATSTTSLQTPPEADASQGTTVDGPSKSGRIALIAAAAVVVFAALAGAIWWVIGQNSDEKNQQSVAPTTLESEVVVDPPATPRATTASTAAVEDGVYLDLAVVEARTSSAKIAEARDAWLALLWQEKQTNCRNYWATDDTDLITSMLADGIPPSDSYAILYVLKRECP